MPKTVNECVACGNESSARSTWATRLLALAEPFEVVACSECGLQWLSPQPTDAEYDGLYQAAYFGKATGGEEETLQVAEFFREYLHRPNHYETVEAVSRREQFQTRLSRLGEFLPQGGSILDVGAATGDFLNEATQRGWQVTGIEPSEHGCRRAFQKFGLRLENTSIFGFDAAGQTFDVVHLNHVFEHLPQPVAALELFRTWMHEDSILLIEIPNQFASVVAQMRSWVKGPKPRDLYSIHHPYFYEPRHLVRILEKTGFEIMHKTTHAPGRWKASRLRKALGVVDYFASALGSRGDIIEVIARKAAHKG